MKKLLLLLFFTAQISYSQFYVKADGGYSGYRAITISSSLIYQEDDFFLKAQWAPTFNPKDIFSILGGVTIDDGDDFFFKPFLFFGIEVNNDYNLKFGNDNWFKIQEGVWLTVGFETIDSTFYGHGGIAIELLPSETNKHRFY